MTSGGASSKQRTVGGKSGRLDVVGQAAADPDERHTATLGAPSRDTTFCYNGFARRNSL
jgi:hypothetical protein